jgi:glycosyltransferase involved in cell wall biosynthesis
MIAAAVIPGDRSAPTDIAGVGEAIRIALLTGGQDRHYSHGLATALAAKDVQVDFIGSDELDSPELRKIDRIRFLNLRGSQDRRARVGAKIHRVCTYYGRLIRYAARSDLLILHILWNNKVEVFDRTVLMLYYRMLGKKVIFTAHNVNAGRRDHGDTFINRLTLGMQYRLSEHIFVHTDKMKCELIDDFSVPARRVTVIPYGINNVVPDTALTPAQAKEHFGIGRDERTILFFGQIGLYKGLDYLVSAFEQLLAQNVAYRLIVAGKPKPKADNYWQGVLQKLQPFVDRGRAILDIRFIRDETVEFYFKAADVLVLPYREIFQSGILFLGYRFGLPAIAADVGSLRHDIVEGRTGLVCRPDDSAELARTIDRYFSSDLFTNLDSRRQDIRAFTNAHHSWATVAELTREVYAKILETSRGRWERAS